MKVYVTRTLKRTLQICPQSDGSVTVVAYRFLSQKTIANHIAQNMPWIVDRLKKVVTQKHCSISSRPTDDCLDNTFLREQSIVLSNQIVKDIFAGKSMLLC